jgi:hypothetical protein
MPALVVAGLQGWPSRTPLQAAEASPSLEKYPVYDMLRSV